MPPAEKATIARTGLVGQVCAHASPLSKTRPRTDSNVKQVRVMSFFLVSRQTLRGRCATRQQPPVLSILRIAQRGTAGDYLRCGTTIGPMSRFGVRKRRR